MKNWVIIIVSALLLSGCNNNNNRIQLPDAKIHKPYHIHINLTDQLTSKRLFSTKILPETSGITVKPAGNLYNSVVILGTPKTQQTIIIDVYYVILGPIGIFEEREQTKHYKINVKN